MTTENEAKNPYAAVLADLRAKRAEIDNTIRILEQMSGLKLSDVGGAVQWVQSNGEASDEAPANDAGLFLGMSIVDASKKLLALRKRAMGNPEIARELAAGGLAMTASDPVNVVGSVLTRRFNQVGDIVKISRGTWGLKEWYPNRTFKPAGKSKVSDPAELEPEDDTVNVPIEADIAEMIGATVKTQGPPSLDDDLDDDVPF